MFDDDLETDKAAGDPVECPFCGEPGEVDADIDPSEPGEHLFVQDCDVCCRPWAVRVVVGHGGRVRVSVDRS